ncbi:MAG: MgtC/SapB family protein [Lachnospiraceae bacterium]|jgi:putative Mg2+ transporter-C (MgtC) family protein|nr:MgtC/SapB family protein [Lachnospiraceae bacterium]
MPFTLIDNVNIECAIRLLVACVCGGAIGIERTRRNKGAGIRTHMIVAVGAALFVIISKYGFQDILLTAGTRVDVSRVAAGITTGVGFLGAGIIFMRGNSVHGLTTAAGIWATAAIGSALGVGMYLVGIVSTVLIVVLQVILHNGVARGWENTRLTQLVVVMQDNPEEFEKFQGILESKHIEITGGHINKHKDASLMYTLDVRMPLDLQPSELLELVKKSGAVKSIGM